MTFTARHSTVAGTMAGEYAFTMKDLRKVVPPKREILKGIWLSFYPGRQDRRARRQRRRQEHAAAHHGRRRQGLPRRGVARRRASGSATCRRSRSSTRRKNVQGNVEEGVAETRALLTRFEEVDASSASPSPTTRWRSCSTSRRGCRTRSTRPTRWELDRTVEIAMDALRCPPGDADVTQALRRRAAPRRAVPAAARRSPTCCCSTSPPTTSTPSRSPGSSSSSRSSRAPSSPSPTIATSSTTSRAGSSSSTAARASRGRATTPPGSSRSRSGWPTRRSRTSARQRTLAARARVGAHVAARAPGQEQGAPRRRYEELLAEADERARRRQLEIVDPARPAPGRRRGRGRAPPQGLRRPPADRRPDVQAAARRHRRRHRPQRRRQDDAVPHDHRPGEARRAARSRSARR